MSLTAVTGPRPRGLPSVRFMGEVAIVVGAWLAYFGVRTLTEGNAALAEGNAKLLVDLERALGIFWEPALQEAVLRSRALETAANLIYIWGHWPVIIAAGVWLRLRRPATYFVVRNAFLISGAIGLVIFATFPMAPPRLTDLPVVDTVTIHSHTYRVLQPPALTNQYAAMPSLHFGWNLLIGLALIRTATTRPLKAFGWVMPVLMAVAVVITANHYLLDVVAGATVALLGLLLAWLLRQRRTISPDESNADADFRAGSTVPGG